MEHVRARTPVRAAALHSLLKVTAPDAPIKLMWMF